MCQFSGPLHATWSFPIWWAAKRDRSILSTCNVIALWVLATLIPISPTLLGTGGLCSLNARPQKWSNVRGMREVMTPCSLIRSKIITKAGDFLAKVYCLESSHPARILLFKGSRFCFCVEMAASDFVQCKYCDHNQIYHIVGLHTLSDCRINRD